MSWVDDRLDNQKRSEKERALISIHAEKVYNDLWKEISDRVDDAKKRGKPAETNGSPYERTVLMGAGNIYQTRPEDSRQLTITLARTEGKIIALDSDGNSLDIELMVSEGDIVRPKHQGRTLTIPEAAKLILEPFLFPPMPNR
jgi:hypothetical protein